MKSALKENAAVGSLRHEASIKMEIIKIAADVECDERTSVREKRVTSCADEQQHRCQRWEMGK